MNREAFRSYNRQWMREWRERERLAKKPQKLLAKGKCPICDMFLVADYHIANNQEHIQAIIFMMQGLEQTLIRTEFHTKIDILKENGNSGGNG